MRAIKLLSFPVTVTRAGNSFSFCFNPAVPPFSPQQLGSRAAGGSCSVKELHGSLKQVVFKGPTKVIVLTHLGSDARSQEDHFLSLSNQTCASLMKAATGFPETGTFSSKMASRNSRFPAPLSSFPCRTGIPLQKVSAFCYLQS